MSRVVTIFTTGFNIIKRHVLPAICTCVLCMDLRTNSDYFLTQHLLIGFYNRDEVFTARYGLGV